MKALFAGSFDPFTVGHTSIVWRGLKIFDSIVIGIGYNENKPGEWTVEERLNAISEYWEREPRIEVRAFSGLTADFAREVGADVLLRGVRSTIDFEYERNLADINRTVFDIDTVLLFSLPELSFVSSSMVRELIHNGQNVDPFIAGTFPIKKKQ